MYPVRRSQRTRSEAVSYTWTTDNLGFAVSESAVYRILRREGLVKSPEMQLKAGKE